MKALNEIVTSTAPYNLVPPNQQPLRCPRSLHASVLDPKSGRDLNVQLLVLPVAARRDRLVRQLFTKISRGLDAKNWDLAA